MSRIPNTAIEKGSQAVIGIGRKPWMSGSIIRAVKRLQPIMRPSGMPTSNASRKPSPTRVAE
jgi:hypothetical protein